MSKIVADLCYFSITLITIFSLLLGVKPNLISLEDIVKFTKSICGFKSRVMENNDLFWEQFLSSSSSNNIHEA